MSDQWFLVQLPLIAIASTSNEDMRTSSNYSPLQRLFLIRTSSTVNHKFACGDTGTQATLSLAKRVRCQDFHIVYIVMIGGREFEALATPTNFALGHFGAPVRRPASHDQPAGQLAVAEKNRLAGSNFLTLLTPTSTSRDLPKRSHRPDLSLA
ncbi:hypothetical protein C8J56DRAFT_900155 [Mycena floridula]|nr:hypothetical protein C8J56DRAFT_900155 [Mycena floridula]